MIVECEAYRFVMAIEANGVGGIQMRRELG